jgi:release factor glutamine methyltransferase
MTIAQALALHDHKHEALLLLYHVTGFNPTYLRLNDEQVLDPACAERYLSLLAQRRSKIPLQYILGCWDFCGLTFATDPRALIPRAETELLAEAVLKRSPTRILDLCTGSGCLAVTVAKTLTDAAVVAADICPQALSLARQNAQAFNVSDRITFVQSDLFDGLTAAKNEPFDVIVSNPPYIPTADLDGLQAEVKNHEPRLALDGGADGLTLYKRLIPQSLAFLRPDGLLALEVGDAPSVADLMRQAGFCDIQILHDYAGLPRVVTGQKAQERFS